MTLSAQASVALIDLAQNKVASVIGAGYYPSRLAFAGSNLLVTDEAAGTVSVIDTKARVVSQTVTVGMGPAGIAATSSTAIVANMQAGTLSEINLSTYAVSTIALPAGSRPYEVAVSTAANKALISTPMSNAFLILDLSSGTVTTVDTSAVSAMGPGAIAVNGTLAFLANMMSASVTAFDLTAGKVVKTFSVDPGPRALAVNAAKNQLLVLAEGTGTLDVVDLGSYSITSRLDAGSTERQGTWSLPWITSMNPATAPVGATFTLTISGANLGGVTGIEFDLSGQTGGGMMGGGMRMGAGTADPNIKISSFQANSAGTQITATVQILSAATPGTRLVRLATSQFDVMGMMFNSLFTITK